MSDSAPHPRSRRVIIVALSAGAIGILARLFDPDRPAELAAPMDVRGYYLAAAVVTGLALVGVASAGDDRQSTTARPMLTLPAIALVAATLMFASHRSVVTIAIVTACAALAAFAADASRTVDASRQTPATAVVATIVVMVLFIAGLYEYRLRSAFGGPLAGLAAGLAVFPLTSQKTTRVSRWANPIVTGVISAEVVWALSYLNVSALAAAVIWSAVFSCLILVQMLGIPERSNRT